MPITLGKAPDQITVGCGRCMPCHIKYCNQWSFRFNIHYNQNPTAHCVTLTYDNKNLPTVKNGTKIYQTLVKSHVQDFFKKLRRYHTRRQSIQTKLSYIIAGEYGDKFKRPHYHAIIFNAHPDDILKSWTKGNIYFGNNDIQATLIYTLKYTLKSRIFKLYHSNAPYQRPFMHVSNGIGETLIVTKKKSINVYKPHPETGEAIYSHKHTISCIVNPSTIPEMVQLNNIKTPLPRYYTKKLNINIDTEQFKLKSIIKAQQLNKTIERMGLTPSQWKKQYSNYIWKTDKTHMYDNEILKDLPNELREIIEANDVHSTSFDEMTPPAGDTNIQ